MLGMSEKTLRETWVWRGYLRPLFGGGQGKKILFDKRDVEAFKRNEDMAKFLARVVLGREMDNVDRTLDVYWSKGKTADFFRHYPGLSFIDNKLPQIVPGRVSRFTRTDYVKGVRTEKTLRHDDILKWVQAVGVRLSRKELDFLCALFFRSACPESSIVMAYFNRETFHSFKKSLLSFWSALPEKAKSLKSEEERQRFHTALDTAADSAKQGDTDQLRGFLRKYFREYESQKGATEKEDENTLLEDLASDIKRKADLAKRKARLPSLASVGLVLRIKRERAAQIWGSIRGKLGRQAPGLLAELGKYFVDDPRAIRKRVVSASTVKKTRVRAPVQETEDDSEFIASLFEDIRDQDNSGHYRRVIH